MDPLIQLLGDTTSIPVLRALGLPPGIQSYLRQRAVLVATYAMTIASYLLLVAKETPGLEDHPIGQALLSLQQVRALVIEMTLVVECFVLEWTAVIEPMLACQRPLLLLLAWYPQACSK